MFGCKRPCCDSPCDTYPGVTSAHSLLYNYESMYHTVSLSNQLTFFIKSLPGQQHCYFLNGDAPVQDGKSLQGSLVSKIPFRHPAHVPALLDIIRHQAAYNTLIGSCVKKTYIKEGESGASNTLNNLNVYLESM